MVHVTSHAISRFRERVSPVSYDEAITALSSPVVEKAAAFGAPFVRLGTGQRIVLVGDHVVTVLPLGTWLGTLERQRDGVEGKGGGDDGRQ